MFALPYILLAILSSHHKEERPVYAVHTIQMKMITDSFVTDNPDSVITSSRELWSKRHFKDVTWIVHRIR